MNQKKKTQLAFDTVANGYDHPALSFFAKTAALILSYLDLNDTDKLLDVCCGTGAVSLLAASNLSKGYVTGIDLSEGMLDQACFKAKNQQLKNVQFIKMDLDHLDLKSNSFDVATCSFGLFFLDDMAQGLAQISSKVKPGGKIAISTFSVGAFEPMSNCFLTLYEKFGFEVPPLAWHRLSDDASLLNVFSKAGLDMLKIRSFPLGMWLKSSEDWWNIVWNAGYRGLLMQMSEKDQAKFKQQHLAEVDQMIGAGEKWLDTGVLIAIGRNQEKSTGT